MLKFAGRLPDTNEYAIVWWGQSNATPNGQIGNAQTIDSNLTTRSAGADIVIVGPIDAAGPATLVVTSSTGGPITPGAYADTEIRIGRPNAPGVGYGTVSANTANGVAMTWVQENANLATATVTITSVGTAATVTATAHGLPNGTTVIISGAAEPEYNGTFLTARVDDNSYTYTTLTVPSASPATGTIAAVPYLVPAYIYYRDGRHAKYPNVRVLQAYLPETAVDYPAYTTTPAPGFTYTAPAPGSFADVGVFLPMTFVEGISGYGISEEYLGGPAAAADASSFTWTTAVTANVFAGGYVRVRHDAGVSWATITSNTTTVATVGSWSGEPHGAGWGVTPGNWTYDIWLPHWFDNPHALLPGPGFLHPTNESEPLGVPVANRPRGRTTYNWGTRWGPMFSFAWRLSAALGKRINVIPLAVDASSIIPNHQLFGALTHGWKTTLLRGDWDPQTVGGLADRLEKLITTIAPLAVTADGNTKPLKILGIGGMQGETEATSPTGREQYENALPMFYQWLTELIDDAGLNYWGEPEDLIITHAMIAKSPWEIATSLGGAGDTEGRVNAAITGYTGKRRFARSFSMDDEDAKTPTEIHFNGVGEVLAGQRHARLFLDEIEKQMAMQGALAAPQLLTICNLALGHAGQGVTITSLDPAVDSSQEAVYCAQFWPHVRDMLLARHNWGFATKRTTLDVIAGIGDPVWTYAYALPSDFARAISVLPPGATDDHSVLGLSVPLEFSIEADSDGGPVLYCDQDSVDLRYVAKVGDQIEFSDLFVMAASRVLASHLTGVLVKGDVGMASEQRHMQLAEAYLAEARQADSRQHRADPSHSPPWIRDR